MNEIKTKVFDQMHEGIDKQIADKKVSYSMVYEQNQTMATSTDLSFLSYTSYPPKPISTKTVTITNGFTCLSYSLTPPKLISNNPFLFFQSDKKKPPTQYC